MIIKHRLWFFAMVTVLILTAHSQAQLFAKTTIPETEVACYRIVQEALSNIARHAQATHCQISLELDQDLRLSIQDNGQGLPQKLQPGVGLRSMRERAEELGGSFQVSSNQGTRLLVTLPLHSPSYNPAPRNLEVN